MDTEAWLDCWGDHILRQYLVDMVRAFSRDPAAQEDLLTTAWLTIGDCECGCTTEHLMDVGFYAMLRKYRVVYWKQEKCRWGKSKEYQYVARKRRRFFIKVDGRPPRGRCVDNMRGTV